MNHLSITSLDADWAEPLVVRTQADILKPGQTLLQRVTEWEPVRSEWSQEAGGPCCLQHYRIPTATLYFRLLYIQDVLYIF